MALRDLLAPQTRRTTLIAVAILCTGMATTLAIREFSERLIAADMQRRFVADALDISNAISDRLRTHAEGRNRVVVSHCGAKADTAA